MTFDLNVAVATARSQKTMKRRSAQRRPCWQGKDRLHGLRLCRQDLVYINYFNRFGWYLHSA